MIMDLAAIKKIIPHREPFILIDRIIHNESLVLTTAEKFVSQTEFWIPGHFPNNPVMPGVLIVEALAQTAAVNILSSPIYQDKIGYFSSIQEARFKRRVKPGDTLVLHAKFLSTRSGFFFFEGEAYIGDQLACTASFSVAVGN
jgi:3-hydroxyacyl-[acyl-carrier-protein] dehydratase